MDVRATVPVAVASIALVVAGCSTSAQAAPGTSQAVGDGAAVTQTSDGGQVTVAVEWGGPSAGVEFRVAMDTHSVDLDSLDLMNATLRNDRGDVLSARPWAAPKSGHHRRGGLSFAGDASAFLSGARWIELVLVGVGDIPERTLRWDVRT